MAVQLTTAGNFLARTRRMEPTGEKHRITWIQDTEESVLGPNHATLQTARSEEKALCGLSFPCLGSTFLLPGLRCDHCSATDGCSTDFTTLASDVGVQGQPQAPLQ